MEQNATACQKIIGQYVIEMNNFIGSGQYGSIYTAYRKDCGAQKIVCKIQKLTNNRINQELKIFKEAQGIYIAEVLDVYKTSQCFYIFMKHYQQGDLDYYLQLYRKVLNEEDILALFYKIVQGYYQNIYSRQIIHRDIKTSNILMDDINPYITDFGLSIKFNDLKKEQDPYRIGSLFYQSPQMSEQKGTYSYKTDIFSLGILLYQMIFNQFPRNQRQLSDYENFIYILKNEGSLSAVQFPETKVNSALMFYAKKLILLMITYDEDERIDIQEVLYHKVFDYIKENKNQQSLNKLQQQINLTLLNQKIKSQIKNKKVDPSSVSKMQLNTVISYYTYIADLTSQILNELEVILGLKELLTEVLGVQDQDFDIFYYLTALFLDASIICSKKLLQKSNHQSSRIPFHEDFYQSRFKIKLEQKFEQNYEQSSIFYKELKKVLLKYLPNNNNKNSLNSQSSDDSLVSSQTNYLEQVINYQKNNISFLFTELKNVFIEKIITNNFLKCLQENNFNQSEDLWVFLNFFVCLFDGTIDIKKFETNTIPQLQQENQSSVDEQFIDQVIYKLSIIKSLSQNSTFHIPNADLLNNFYS